MALHVGSIEAGALLAVAAQDPQPGRGVLVVLLVVGLVAVGIGLRLFLGHRVADDDPSPGEGTVMDAAPLTDAPGCDWALAIDTGAGEVLTVRPAQGRACCVHTVRLASTAPLGHGPTVAEHLTWSGDGTRVTGNLVASTTEQDLVTHQRTPRGLGLVATAALARRPGPLVTTPWTDVPDSQPTVDPERLWQAHLDTLQERHARTRGGQVMAVHEVEAHDRCEVAIDVDRGCDHGRHVIHADARVRVHIRATAQGADTARVVVGGSPAWMAGDLILSAATTTSTVGAVDVVGTEGDVARFALDPAHDPATLVLADQADATIQDGELAVAIGSDLTTELTLGPPVDDAADVRVEIRSEPALTVRVTPLAPDASDDLGCACAPNYELRFGELPPGPSTPSPAAQLDVQGRRFQIVRTRGTNLDGTPAWTVQDTEHDDRGPGDDTAEQAGGGTAAGRGGAGAGDVGQRAAGATDPGPTA